MFSILVLSSSTLLHLYLFARLAATPPVVRFVPRRALAVAGAVAWAAVALARLTRSAQPGLAQRLLDAVTMDWFGALFLLAMGVALADAATGFGRWLRRHAAAARVAGLGLGAALAAVAVAQGHRAPEIRNRSISLKNLPAELDGTVVVAASDLHVGSRLGPGWLAERVDQINAQRPDLVLLLGDLLEGRERHPDSVGRAFARLKAPLGVWAVLGNHDGHGGSAQAVRTLEGAGIGVLENRRVEVRPGLHLAGVQFTRGEPAPIAQTIGDAKGAVVLLTHAPEHLEQAAAAGASLALAGHTHGGQIWPFGYVVSLRYPYLAGRYDVGRMPVVVSRGAGTWGPRVRLWRRGEILRIVLRRG